MSSDPLVPISVGDDIYVNDEVMTITALSADQRTLTVDRPNLRSGLSNSPIQLHTYEVYDIAFSLWGPSSAYNTANSTSLNTLKALSTAAVHMRYQAAEDSDRHWIYVIGRNGTLLPATRFEVRLWLNGSGGTLTSGQQGVVQTTAHHFQAVLWQQAAAAPAAPTALFTDTGFDSTLAPWQRTRAAALTAGSADPVYIAYGSWYRAENGNYSYDPWTVVQEFGAEYSVDSSAANWHNVQATADRFIRFRLPGTGELTAAVPIAETATDWQHLDYSQPYINTAGAVYQTALAPILNISRFENIRIRMAPFGGFTGNTPTHRGTPAEFVLRRPPNGWPVGAMDSEFDDAYRIYWDESTGLRLHQLEDESDLTRASDAPGDPNTTPPTHLEWFMKFVGTEDAVTHIRHFLIRPTYARNEWDIWGN